ncbi:testis-specific Y-encoded protein 3-like [Saimiri boliviensis]|uniref:testis-specific Y-encoded protein 3-like n=1 Tax=Saimiri boliviensis TaxID=27679 RepID=UPI003D76F9E2
MRTIPKGRQPACARTQRRLPQAPRASHGGLPEEAGAAGQPGGVASRDPRTDWPLGEACGLRRAQTAFGGSSPLKSGACALGVSQATRRLPRAQESNEEALREEEEALLVEDDIMAEVEVVAEEEADVEREQRDKRAQPGPGPMTPESALEELRAVQLELEPVNARARRAFSQQTEKLERRRKPHLDRRGAIIRGIPGFWANAIVQYTYMSASIRKHDEVLLCYVTDLQVKETKHPIHVRKIMLFFPSNPCFRNKVVTKQYLENLTEYSPSHSTPIQWYQRYERETYLRRHNGSPNFFNWFSDHNFAGSNRITEIIRKDLWRDPLQYCTRMKPPEEGTEISGECIITSLVILWDNRSLGSQQHDKKWAYDSGWLEAAWFPSELELSRADICLSFWILSTSWTVETWNVLAFPQEIDIPGHPDTASSDRTTRLALSKFLLIDIISSQKNQEHCRTI